MVPRECFLNLIRERGYSFKREAKRVQIWKKAGSTSRIAIKRKGDFSEGFVRQQLKYIGMPDDEIEKFISQYKV